MSSSKQLAIIFSGDFPEGNTKNARLKTIAKELVSENWEPTFISVFPSSFSLSIHQPQSRTWHGFKILYTSLARRYARLRLIRYAQILFGQIGLVIYLMVSFKKYDAYYFYSPRFTDSILGLRLLSFFNKEIVVDQTELFSADNDSFLHRKEEKWIAKYATVLLVISSRLFQYYRPMRKQGLHLFPIVVDFERFNIEKEEIPYTLGYIGSFADKDDIDILLQATKQLTTELPKIKLRLIGYNPKLQDLATKVKAMGLQNNVELTGTVAYSDIPWLLQECDTLLMNRDKSNFATYGYPIKLGEYFACKKTVLMSDGLGFSEDFEHGNQVYKYTSSDSASLAGIIRYRYENMGESDAVAIRGYEYASDHFSSKKVVPYLASILNKK